MKLAWIKFYPADWRADPALRMCSLGARGLWMEMLCLMHEAEPRGSLLISGKTVTPRLLAGIVSVSPDEIEHWTSELEAAGVFSRDDDGVIYSRRMRRDEARSEVHRANGAKGGNPRLKPGDNLEDKPQSPDSRLQNRRARTSASRAEPAGEMIALANGVRVPKSVLLATIDRWNAGRDWPATLGGPPYRHGCALPAEYLALCARVKEESG